MKKLLPLLAAGLLAGCADDGIQSQIDALRAESESRERASMEQAAKRQAEMEQAIAELRSELVRQGDANQRALNRLRNRLSELDRKLSEVEREARNPAPLPAPAPVTASNRASRLPISVYSAHTNAASDFIEPPEGPNPDLFPVVVFGIAGKRGVTGTHRSSRFVEAPTPQKNERGEKTRFVREEYEVNEYGYSVGFSVSNLTRSARDITVSAGLEAARFTIPPGETVTNLSGSSTRRYPVTY
jgi:cell division protein FtsB